MKHLKGSVLAALALAAAANICMADSMLRVYCAGDDAGAEVLVNGKFKGECPVDVKVSEGTLQLRVQKPVDAEHARMFEQEIRMGDGTVKKIEAHLGAAELNAEGKKKEEKRRKACPECYPEMVLIPGKNYEIGKYEVTQAQWKAVMGNNPSEISNCGNNCPVENVSWNDIHKFLQKLNAKTGRQYRLPTEEEWEVACYGGSKTEYCGSNDINAVAWYNDHKTHPVGRKQANGYGLYDMTGNVAEWMENEFNEDTRAIRGGGWWERPQDVRAASRSFFTPEFRLASLGFRLARTQEVATQPNRVAAPPQLPGEAAAARQ